MSFTFLFYFFSSLKTLLLYFIFSFDFSSCNVFNVQKPVPTRDNLLAFNRQDFLLCQGRESFFTVTNQSFVAAFEGNFFPVSVFARE